MKHLSFLNISSNAFYIKKAIKLTFLKLATNF